MRIRFKVVFLSVFQYEETIRFQQLLLEDEVWQGLQTGQLIGRVGKDEVKLFVTAADKLEHVASDGQTLVCLYFLHDFADEGIMVAILLYTDYLFAPSGYQFDADAPCSGKEVEGMHSLFKVDEVGEYVEQILFGKICSGTCLERMWYVKSSTLIYSADYSHEVMA